MKLHRKLDIDIDIFLMPMSAVFMIFFLIFPILYPICRCNSILFTQITLIFQNKNLGYVPMQSKQRYCVMGSYTFYGP